MLALKSCFVAAAFAALCACASASASDEVPQLSGPPIQDVVSNEFQGLQLAAVFTAWAELQRSHPDVPPLDTMSITYAKSGDLTMVTFSGPSRTIVRDGRTLLLLGSNFYQVRLSGSDARVISPDP